MADHPLRPATDHGLGKPLPYQQANRAQAHPKVRAEARFNNKYPEGPAALFGISTGFPMLSQSLRQVIYALLTRSPVYYLSENKFSLTCMYQARRQRSSWARIKLSIVVWFCFVFVTLISNAQIHLLDHAYQFSKNFNLLSNTAC